MLKMLAWCLPFLAPLIGTAGAAAQEAAEAGTQKTEEPNPGGQIYQTNCAMCHDNRDSGAPHKSIFSTITPISIYDALTTGRMRAQAAHLSDNERRQVAEYLSGGKLSEARSLPLGMCSAGGNWFDARQPPVGVGWGIDPENTRRIAAKQAGVAAADLGNLKLQWAFGITGATVIRKSWGQSQIVRVRKS